MKRIEEPCAVDGKSCCWVEEEEYLLDGRVEVDTYCSKCFRYRDWTKDEYEQP